MKQFMLSDFTFAFDSQHKDFGQQLFTVITLNFSIFLSCCNPSKFLIVVKFQKSFLLTISFEFKMSFNGK